MAAVAQRQTSPLQSKRSLSLSSKADIKPDNTPPKDVQMDTPSNYLVAEKFLAAEHNPFEQSFAIRPSSSSAPGGNGTETPKPALPSVMEMFTPGGTNQYEHFNFAESLRHGPLSPNLLSGPQGPLPFDPANFRTGLTPNESNIRTGLTPGTTPGFPMLPTPGTAALLGAYTPNTAAAISSMQSTTFPTVAPFPAAQAAARPADVFGESQAANGLVFLAQTSQQQQQQAQATQNIGPAAGTREDVKRIASNNAKANSFKEKEESVATGKGQRTRKGNKEEIAPSKDNAKKLKTKNTPETDDDKRKNFLERNRQAALKCRQRKKQWLNSLQQKVDYYTRENEVLRSELGQLKEQCTALRTLLLAHKDCPVAQQNGATSEAITQAVGQTNVFPVHGYR